MPAAQERDREHDQRQQADADGKPREQHGAAGGGDRGVDRVLVVAAVGALLGPAADHQQCVIDRHPEADQGDQELDDLADGRQVREPSQRQEGGEDRDAGDHQRHERQEAGEHEREHDKRAERSQHRLGQHPGALAGGPARRQRLHARDPHLPGCGHGGADGALDAGGQIAGRHRVALRSEHQRVRAAPVGGRERRIAGGGVVGDPRGRRYPSRGRERVLEPGGNARGVDRGAARQRDYRHGRILRAVAAIKRLDPRVGAKRGAGHREAVRQPLGRAGRGHRPGCRQGEPERDDQQLVPENETGQRRHHGPPRERPVVMAASIARRSQSVVGRPEAVALRHSERPFGRRTPIGAGCRLPMDDDNGPSAIYPREAMNVPPASARSAIRRRPALADALARLRLSPLAFDIGFAVAMAVITLLGSLAEGHPNQQFDKPAPGHHIPHVPPAAALLVLASALVLIWRRRAPVAVLAVSLAAVLLYTCLGYVNGAAMLNPIAALYAVAVTCTIRQAIALSLVTMAALLAASAAFDPLGATGGGFPLIPGVVAAALFLGLWVASRHAYARREGEDQARRAVDAERLRIARELHDVVAHTMATINVQAGAAGHVIEAQPEQLHKHSRRSSRPARRGCASCGRSSTSCGKPTSTTRPRRHRGSHSSAP
jgi:Histidine kinase